MPNAHRIMVNMQTSPLVSVVIPTYNAGHFIARCVESVLAQTYRPLEIIVVNDGSTDHTVAALAPYRSRIRYFYQENQGQSTARNRAIAESQGELIAFVDADDMWLPEKIARQVKALARSPRASLIHTDLFFLDNATGHKVHRADKKAEYVGNCAGRMFMQNKVTISSVLVRKECLARAGMFDGTFRYVDDYEMWLRIAAFFDFGYVDEPLVIYRIHEDNISRSVLAMRREELAALQKILRRIPFYRSVVDNRLIRQRLYELAQFVGYLYYAEEKYAAAHGYLDRALRTARPDLYTSLLWAVTFFPPRVVNALRRLQHWLRPAAWREPPSVYGRISSPGE
jgi:glycosyltransferase involved in cell wall biosynthesis